jgi:flagellar biosynthesis anti-sigma factor FlgM
MNVNDPNLSSLNSASASNLSPGGAAPAGATQGAERTNSGTRATATSASPAAGDDVHLSELVRSLRSLAADSPERQARLEQLARAHATGAYEVDTSATASKIIDDTLRS